MNWVDSFQKAYTILEGRHGARSILCMRPPPAYSPLFARFTSDSVLLIFVGIVLAPVFHRVLHRFRLN